MKVQLEPPPTPTMTKAANRPHRTTEPKLRHEPPHRRFWEKTPEIARRGTTLIALLALAGIRAPPGSAIRLSRDSRDSGSNSLARGPRARRHSSRL